MDGPTTGRFPLRPASPRNMNGSTNALSVDHLPSEQETPYSRPNPERSSFPQPLGGTSDDDPQIVEALKSKDRLYVLKLGEQFELMLSSAQDKRYPLFLSADTSYQRLLVRRCSALYKLLLESDPVTKVISVTSTAESRIPPRRIADLVPAAETAQPAFKIMQRSAVDRRPKPQSHASSVAGDDAELSDVDPSESGSIGGMSNVTGGSNKKHLTIEEREAAYNAARSRIFMGFEDQARGGDKDGSSSVGVSDSVSAGGFVDDDPLHSPLTESEWSDPNGRDRVDLRRTSPNNSSSSSWSWRSPGPSSSRSSPSPSFSYPTLFDPSNPNPNPPFDPPQVPPHHGVGGSYGQIFYPFPNYAPPNPSYLAPHYGGFPGYPPPHSPQNGHEPGPPPPQGEMYSPPPQAFAYPSQYIWPPSNVPPPPQPPNPQPLMPNNMPTQHPVSPPPGQMPFSQYPPPPHPPNYGYPLPFGYPTPPPNLPNTGPLPMPLGPNGPGRFDGHAPIPPPPHPMYRNGSGHSSSNVSRSSSRSSGMGKRRLWNGSHNDSVGPRMNTVRRVSNDKKSSPNDDGSSVASSSTTSSSSRRTYTSTTSSQQHPLPARPDWAVGLKAQPTLHPTRHDSPVTRNGASPAPRNAFPPRQQASEADFPPLSSNSSDRRSHMIPGVWNTSARAAIQPANGCHLNGVSHSNGIPGFTNGTVSLEPAAVSGPAAVGPEVENEQDPDYERPPPKNAQELFNPKATKRQLSGNQVNDKTTTASAITAQLAAVSIEDHKGARASE